MEDISTAVLSDWPGSGVCLAGTGAGAGARVHVRGGTNQMQRVSCQEPLRKGCVNSYEYLVWLERTATRTAGGPTSISSDGGLALRH